MNKNKQDKRENKGPLKLVIELLITTAIAAALAFGIQAFLYKPFVVPSASMKNTLQCNDRIIAQRFGEVTQGNIIVFHPPRSPQKFLIDPDYAQELTKYNNPLKETYVKRLIGQAGDEVTLRNGKAYVNGKALTEPYLHKDKFMGEWGPVEVPDGFVLVLGDNRNYSADSRSFGLVPVENILGEVKAVYWPLSAFGKVDNSRNGSSDGSSC